MFTLYRRFTMNDTIELWEQEIEQEDRNKRMIEEARIYNFYGDNVEPIQEGIISGILTAIGLYLAACVLIMASIIIHSRRSEAKRKETVQDLLKNPKSKTLIEKALKNLQEFVYKNLPNNARKYVIKKQNLSLTEYEKDDTTISQNGILKFDSDKLVADLVDGGYKSVEDLITDGYEEDEKQSVLDDPDVYIEPNEKEYKRYAEFIDSMNRFTKEFNQKIKSIPNKYGMNISLVFDDVGGVIQYGLTPSFAISFKIPSKSISSFTEEELQEIEKVSNTKLS